MSSIFGRRSSSQKTNSAGSSLVNNNFGNSPNDKDSKWECVDSDDAVSIRKASNNDVTNSSSHSISNPRKSTNVVSQGKAQNPNETKIRKSLSPTQGYVNKGKRNPKEDFSISGELESMINDQLMFKGSNNVSMYGTLGNLRGGGAGLDHNHYNEMNYYAGNVSNGGRTDRPIGREYGNSNYNKETKPRKEQSNLPCRTLSTRMVDPEQLKIMGNEDYKNGRFCEALALYDAAIEIDPQKAFYRSNKSAALTALGRLLEAVFECREAIRIDSHYQRAHNRLGKLHFRQAGPEADPDEIAKVKILQVHLNKCTEARRLGDWNTLIKETNTVLSSGADSAPQIYALQAESQLKLLKHEDADKVMSKCPKFDVDDCTKFFGPIGNANLLVTWAQVDLVNGRFENALEAAQKAMKLDPNSGEANKVLRNVRGVISARTKGNELFKASKFNEACIVYEEGIEHDPYNSILLCNRAACRSKLGQFDKAIDDCILALNLRPSYTKARLRRAFCNAKLERWEAAIQDYKILLKETPEDEEVKRALLEAQAQLKQQRAAPASLAVV
ncbi:unnamed protein product [Sphenostylis stenocarpa]|uniref:Uncharacterized protein n=1 Tax=Sphenostylis stenocarpa TaxID=92480 RepID=A0AA86VVT1_9FABA|nr:unnamed protein product [Sphenostylis stenocarpa]